MTTRAPGSGDPSGPSRRVGATAAQFEALVTVGQLVARERSLELVVRQVARLLTESLAADGCLIYQVEDAGELVVVACYPERSPAGPRLRLPGGFGVVGRVAADGIAAVLVDDQPRNPLHRALLGLAGGETVSRLCVPARTSRGGCAAVVAVHSRTRRRFEPAECAFVAQVADLVGLRVHLEGALAATDTFDQEWEGLVAATVTAQETERRRVAGELHDGVTQALAGLVFHLSAAQTAAAQGDLGYVAEQVGAARTLADLAFAEARRAIAGLHSPVLDDLGLAAALASLARAIPNLEIEVEAEALELAAHVEMALFRIAQEALQNVVKHAAAQRAVVRLVRRGRGAVLTVTDDGHGFDAPGELLSAPRGRLVACQFGLSGMYERVQLLGGRLAVTSRAGEGTTVTVTLPNGSG